VRLSVPEEVCLVKKDGDQKRGSGCISYSRLVNANSGRWKEYRVVPLKPGHYNISLVATTKGYSDAINKVLYVVVREATVCCGKGSNSVCCGKGSNSGKGDNFACCGNLLQGIFRYIQTASVNGLFVVVRG